jgi:hypothetical protein
MEHQSALFYSAVALERMLLWYVVVLLYSVAFAIVPPKNASYFSKYPMPVKDLNAQDFDVFVEKQTQFV